MATLEELLVGKTADEIVDQLLAYLNAEKVDPSDPASDSAFAVSDWESGGAERTNVEMEARALEDLVSEAIPNIAAGSLITKAEGKWLELRASDSYKIAKTKATRTRIQLKLTDSANAGPFSFGVDELVWETESGLRFYNESAGTIPLGLSLDVVVRAEGTGAKYNVATGALVKWVTPLPGVVSSHDLLDFSAVKEAKNGQGVVTTNKIGTLASNLYKIIITSNGNTTAGSLEWFINGISAGTASPIPATLNLDAGVQVAFTNGPVNPSFVKDDTFTFASLASPIVEPGRDDEGDAQLRKRCQARWPDLGLIPTDDKYIKLAKEAYVGVTKVATFPHSDIAGATRVVVAGQGTIGPSNLTDIETYITERDATTDRVIAEEATDVNLTVTGTVIVPAKREAAIKVAAQAAWDLHVDDEIDIGGVAAIFELQSVLEDAGATNATGIAFTGANAPVISGGANVDVALTPTQVGRSTSLASQLTWKAV